MGRKFWRSAGVFGSIVAGVGVAGAADLYVKAPVYKAAPGHSVRLVRVLYRRPRRLWLGSQLDRYAGFPVSG